MSQKLAKIVLVGDKDVGKTCIVSRYANNEYDNESVSTIGVEFLTKTVALEDDSIKLQIWDSSGQERFAVVGRAVYHGAKAFILVASHTSVESLAKLKERATSIVETVGRGTAHAVLVLTKSDDPNQTVSVADAVSLIPELKALGVQFISEDPFSISAKNDYDSSQVAAIFSLVAADVASRMNAEASEKSESDKEEDDAPGSENNHDNKKKKKTNKNFFGFKV